MRDRELLERILIRQDAILDMLSSFMQVYARQNNLPIENVKEECEYINDIEGFDE